MKHLTNFDTMYKFGNVTLMCNLLSVMPCIQDTIHLANKIKCAWLDNVNDFWFGNHLASVNHIHTLISDPNLSKININ